MRRLLESKSEMYLSNRKEIRVLRAQMRRLRMSLRMAQAGLICVMPDLLIYAMRQVRQRMKYPVAYCSLVEERWLMNRLDRWGVPSYHVGDIA